MRVDVAQVFAMCCHSNAFLASGEDRASEMFGRHSTFKTCQEVVFERGGGLVGGAIAEGVAPWLRRLNSESATTYRVVLSPCQLQNKPAKEALWGIVSDTDCGLEVWRPTWSAKMRRAKDPEPHKVLYVSERISRHGLGQIQPIELQSARLLTDLERCLEGVKKLVGGALETALTKCVDLHRDGNGEIIGFPDLLPPLYGREARSLTASAVRVGFVLGSGLWSEAKVETEYQPLLTALGNATWASTMAALESVACSDVAVAAQAA